MPSSPTPNPQAKQWFFLLHNASAVRVTMVKGMEALVTLPKSSSNKELSLQVSSPIANLLVNEFICLM